MKNILITGVSSGIGKALTLELCSRGYKVVGIARRGDLLESLKKQSGSKNFDYLVLDLSSPKAWDDVLEGLKKKRFTPDVVLFNAALVESDLLDGINLKKTRQLLEINFFSILEGVASLMADLKKATFVAISSSSSLKGSAREGMGYAASKAALSLAFESLYLKYKNTPYKFKTIYLGPVNSGSGKYQRKPPPGVLSEKKVVENIIYSIGSKKSFFYYPNTLFTFLRIGRILPNHFYLKALSALESLNSKT